MAASTPLLFLLLLLLIASISATALLSEPTIQTDQQLHNIMEALVGAGDFANWASALSVTDPSSFPITATLFVPTQSAASVFNPSTIFYHIVPRQLSFSDLLLLRVGSRLPTLLPAKSILVTNNTRQNYTIDDSPILRPDLYINGAVTVHGIGSVLNYSAFGGGFFPIQNPEPDSNPNPNPNPSGSSSSSSPPESSWNPSSAEACSCIELPVIALVVFGVIGLRIHGFYPIR